MSHTDDILAEIARKGSTRDSIVAFYRDGIIACKWGTEGGNVDWIAVNHAILERYKVSGLNYIKAKAWKR